MKKLVKKGSFLTILLSVLILMFTVNGYAQVWTTSDTTESTGTTEPTGMTEPSAMTKAAEKELKTQTKEAEKLRKEQLKAEKKRLKEEEKRLKKEEKAREKAEKARLKEEEKQRKEAEKNLSKDEKKRLKEEKKRLKEEAKWRKEEEKRLKKLEKEKLKAEEKIRKEEAKRRKSSVVKYPETPEGKAAEMILKYYEFYFPIMMVYEENEQCLRKGGVDKANLCRKMGEVGDARITKIKTFLGAPEEIAGKKRTTVAAKLEGTIFVKGKKRTVKREEYFYLDNRKDVMEFSDAHGIFRLTFKK